MRRPKQAIKAGDKRRIGRRIVDGACHDEAVRLLEFRGQLIHHVVKHAFAELGAAVAGHAAAHGLIADLHGLDRNAALRKNFLHFPQSDGRVCFGTAKFDIIMTKTNRLSILSEYSVSQQELEMPVLPQRIAVISSATAAGYGDFCHQLQHNSGGFFFYTELFPALMQGNQVEESVLAALDRINDRVNEFDVVVIIRGGGATSDLSGFDE